jgi:hypothetical protein
VIATERSAAYEWGFEKGELAERERIIKLLSEEDALNSCFQESDIVLPKLIALIKGENK